MRPKSVKHLRVLFICLFVIGLSVSFQNCAQRSGEDIFNSLGGEPYPGLDPGGEMDFEITYRSNNGVCADGKISDEIKRINNTTYHEYRKNCTDVTLAVPINLIVNILLDANSVPISFEYEEKVFERINPPQ